MLMKKWEDIMNNKLEKYIPFVDFLAEILGRNSEVVLHDLSNLNHSVVAIRNSHISNRQVGAPATDLVLKILKENKHQDRHFISNYQGKTAGNKDLKSSTFFIREKGELIGMICVNTDKSLINNLEKIVEDIVYSYNKTNNKDQNIHDENLESENLSHSIEEMTRQIVHEITEEKGVKIEYLKQEDKLEIIRDLNNRGVFLLKGAVPEIANIMKTSESSIYRYLQIIKREEASTN